MTVATTRRTTGMLARMRALRSAAAYLASLGTGATLAELVDFAMDEMASEHIGMSWDQLGEAWHATCRDAVALTSLPITTPNETLISRSQLMRLAVLPSLTMAPRSPSEVAVESLTSG